MPLFIKAQSDVPKTVKYITTEGTWMSPDVSPDGRNLIFDLVGDIYTLPIAGGDAVRITSGPAIDAQPRYSPDGRSVVFVSDRGGSEQLWVMNLSQRTVTQITNEHQVDAKFTSPIWTPDGRFIIAVRRIGFNTSILRYRVAGVPSSGTELLKGGYAPTMGQDTKHLWYLSSSSFNYSQPIRLAKYEFLTKRSTVFDKTNANRMDPVISHDGSWLVYGKREDSVTVMVLRDLRTDGEKEFARFVDLDIGSMDSIRDVMPTGAFTPSDSAIIVSSHGKLWSISIYSGDKTQIPFQALVEQEITSSVKFKYPINDTVLTVRQIRDAKLSPDGRRLVFVALERIWVMDYPHGKPYRLTNDTVGENFPTWSPDGKYIAYSSWNTKSSAIYRIKSDGSAMRECLTREIGEYRKPAYTPDGKKIVAIRSLLVYQSEFPPKQSVNESQDRLVYIPADGGKVNDIGPSYGDGLPYFIQNDTTRIFQWGNWVSWKGKTGRIAITNGNKQPIISPDGKYALFAVDRGDLSAGTLDVLVVPVTDSRDAPKKAIPYNGRIITNIGGDYVGWAQDGRSFYWSLGNVFMQYNMVDVFSGISGSIRPSVSVDVHIVVPKAKPTGLLLLRGAKIVTMCGDEIFSKGDVLINGARIVSVGPVNSAVISPGTRIFDLTGKIIMPGLIDLHVHSAKGMRSVRRNGLYQGQHWQYAAPLAYGVTTQRDPQSKFSDIFGDADLVDAGMLYGPRMFSTGPGISKNANITSYEGALKILKRYADYYHSTLIKQYLVGDRLSRQQLIAAARTLHLTATVEGSFDFKMGLGNILDGYQGHEHAYMIAPLYNDVLQLLKASGIVYTSTLLVGKANAFPYYLRRYNLTKDPKLRRFVPLSELVVLQRRGNSFGEPLFSAKDSLTFVRYAQVLKYILQVGGYIGVGSHGELQGLGVHWEMWAMSAGGLPSHDILRAATITGAQAIGREDDLGSIEPGKLADIIILDKDPLVDIHNTTSIRYVIRNGYMYDAETLDEVWPDQRKFPRQWWMTE